MRRLSLGHLVPTTNASTCAFSPQDAHRDALGGPRLVDATLPPVTRTRALGLYATVSFWAEGTALPGVEVYRRLAADTPARAQAIADAVQDPGFRLDSLTKLQVAGFAITSYSGDSATVAIAFQLANGAFYAAPLAMAWQDGDWKAVMPAGGGVPGAGQIPDLSGYVPWSGA